MTVESRTCDVCQLGLDPDADDTHFGHEEDCEQAAYIEFDCRCDLAWHDRCCPDCLLIYGPFEGRVPVL